ncbi:MAG: hypothetical protein LT070_02050 [Solirubrobacteraceae bacterium]|nr:hypothetical protein [Solirubrobacteraceae bacterium]
MPRISPALLVATLTLGLAACGGGDDGGATTATTAAPAATRSCGIVAFTAQSDDGAFDIKARGADCPTARTVARASRMRRLGEEPYRFTAAGFTCVGTPHTAGELAGVRYRCTSGDAVVTFDRT